MARVVEEKLIAPRLNRPFAPVLLPTPVPAPVLKLILRLLPLKPTVPMVAVSLGSLSTVLLALLSMPGALLTGPPPQLREFSQEVPVLALAHVNTEGVPWAVSPGAMPTRIPNTNGVRQAIDDSLGIHFLLVSADRFASF